MDLNSPNIFRSEIAKKIKALSVDAWKGLLRDLGLRPEGQVTVNDSTGTIKRRWELAADERVEYLEQQIAVEGIRAGATANELLRSFGEVSDGPNESTSDPLQAVPVFSFDVFLSYSSTDKQVVNELNIHLKANGLSSWIDDDQLRLGMPSVELLEQGIRNSKSFMVCVGEKGFGPWQKKEMNAALDLAVRFQEIPVIPVLLPGTKTMPELPMLMRTNTWVDLRSGFSREGLKKLIWGITDEKRDDIVFP